MIMNKNEISAKIEELLEKPYVVIDFLPEQVSVEKGDNYFKTEYLEQNLHRARCQLKLAQSMMQNYDKMQEIIEEYYNEYCL